MSGGELESTCNYDLPIHGTISALNESVELDTLQKDSQCVSVSGTWSGTLAFQITTDGVNWFPATAINLSTGAIITTTIGNGNFIVLTAGCYISRIVATAFTSGSAVIDNEGTEFSQYINVIQLNSSSLHATVAQGVPNAIANSWPIKITNSTNTAGVTSALDVQVADAPNSGGLDTIINLTVSAVEGKVGASRKTNRKYIEMQALSNNVKWGYSSGTQSFDLFKNQFFSLPCGDNTQIWFKVSSGIGSIAFGEK